MKERARIKHFDGMEIDRMNLSYGEDGQVFFHLVVGKHDIMISAQNSSCDISFYTNDGLKMVKKPITDLVDNWSN